MWRSHVACPAPDQGTVGTCPAFSWASRAALSPASCVASSLGTNLPVDEPGVGVGLAAVVAAAALRGETPYRAAPATPPTSIDPAMAAAVIAVRTLFMACLIPPVVFRSSVGTEVGVGGSACRVRRL